MCQIVLVLVSTGLAILLIRGVSRRAAASPADQESAERPDTAQDTPDTAQETRPGPSGPGAENPLTERVRTEMFGRSGAPSPATETE